MKRARKSIKRVVCLVVVGIAVLVLNTCSTVTEPDDAGKIIDWPIKPGTELTLGVWTEILEKIHAQSSLVNLDLSDYTVDDTNTGGGLVRKDIAIESDVTGDPLTPLNVVVFDPVSVSPLGKDKIVSLILPKVTERIEEGKGKQKRPSPGEVAPIEFNDITPSFKYFTRLKTVKGANVTKIGNYAFSDLKSLEKVEFPNVTHILGDFELATGLAVATSLPPSIDGYWIVDIGHAAFLGCTALKEVKIEAARIIGRGAFQGCTSLQSFIFSDVWNIGEQAFQGCTGLTEVIFPNATKIGNYSFAGCTRLTEASFPSQLEVDGANKTAVDTLFRDPLSHIQMMGGSGNGDDADRAYKYSIIFYDAAFSGCSALKTLNIRNALNVHFRTLVFEKIGKSLDIHLSDKRHSLTEGKMFGESTTITLGMLSLYGLSTTNFQDIREDIENNPDLPRLIDILKR